MRQIDIVCIESLPTTDLQPLLEESRAQGFGFLDRLVSEYLNDTNRFSDGPPDTV